MAMHDVACGLSRRQFIVGAATAAGSAILAACGGGNAAPTNTPQASTAGGATAAAPTTAAATAAATKPPAAGGVLTHAQKDPVASLDPYNPGGTLTSQEIFRHIYDGLVIFDENLQPQPNLAESWTVSTDQTEWTFKLHPGVMFHDGTPLNAASVQYHFNRLIDPKGSSSFKATFGIISEIRTPDDATVVFKTSTPFGPFLNYMAHAAGGIVSKAAVEKYGQDYPVHPVGAGPYKLQEFLPGDRCVLVRFDQYWKGRPALDGITFKTIPEDGARAAALEAGEADTMIPVAVTSVPELKQRKELVVESKPIITMLYAGFNLSKPPFDDLKVRQALSMAVDRKGIIDGILGGFATIADSPMAKGTFGYAPSPTYDYDPTKAQALLKDAGWTPGSGGVVQKNGTPMKFTLWTPQDLYLKDVAIAQAIQAQLKAVGADVDLKTVESANWFTTVQVPVAQAPYDMFMWSLTPSTGDGYQQLDELTFSDPDPTKPPAHWNLTHYKNPHVDELIKTAGSVTDQDQRKAALKEAQGVVMQDAPLIFLLSYNFVLGRKAKVQGVRLLPTRFVDLREASFTQ
jgi:ABC-type transport system substrate-binding protein